MSLSCSDPVMDPRAPSASAHAVRGMRQRRFSKLSRQKNWLSLSVRALLTGFGFRGWPDFLLFSDSGKPHTIDRIDPLATTNPGYPG